ncbi:MAG: LytTR family DNA-binding domain-containing protein [Lachnospiraceae bacterium]|nr:LytTR family DNA-binding domain-containing protein [Lachnospiraceae bacterium]
MINIAICDIHMKDRETLSRLVSVYIKEQLKNSQLFVFRTGEELLHSHHYFDIILLDTELGSMDGIEVGKKLREKYNHIKLIYITSHGKKWYRAINEAHAFAYLEKPISTPILTCQLRTASKSITQEINKNLDSTVLTFQVMTEHSTCEKPYVRLKDFHLNEIYYFEYENRMVKCNATHGQYYLFKEKLSHILEQTKDHCFVCCHKGYIVNLAQVSGIQGHVMFLENGATVPLAQKRASQIRLCYKEYTSCHSKLKK